MRGPSAGYDIAQKRHYRRSIYAFADRVCGVPRVDRSVVYLESSHGEETKFLMEQGYSSRQLHPVNRNAAEMAWLTRRLASSGYESVRTHGCELGYVPGLCQLRVSAALGTCPDQTGLIVNADYCGPITPQRLCQISGLSAIPGAIIGVNFLRGRERPDILRLLNMWEQASRDKTDRISEWLKKRVRNTYDAARALLVLSTCYPGGVFTTGNVAVQIYNSGRSTMMWLAWKVPPVAEWKNPEFIDQAGMLAKQIKAALAKDAPAAMLQLRGSSGV